MPTALTNLVVNPSIETNTTNWTANGGATLTRVSTQFQSGAWSLQVACTAVANSGTQCAAITAGVGETYAAGVYLRGNVGGETVDVQLRNQAGTVITTVPVTLTTAWQRFALTGVTPGSTTSINLRVNKTAATAHTYFLDAAMVTSGGQVWPYFDGTIPGARWTGTAHASTSEMQIASGSGNADYDYRIDWSGAEGVVENLIFDPSAEAVADGWTDGGGGTRSIVFDPVHSQAHSMQYTITTGAYFIFLASVGNPGNVNIPGITAGNRYSASLWVRSTFSLHGFLRIRWMTSAGGADLTWSDFTFRVIPANTWTLLAVNGVVAPATVTHARLGFNTFDIAAFSGQSLWFDDATLTETDVAVPYFDGVLGGTWTGTPYASTSEMMLATFEGAGADVSPRVDGQEPVGISYGRDSARALAPTTSGQASFKLHNISRDYSPDNEASPLAGAVIPGRPVRVNATIGADTYTLFRGFLDDLDLDPQAKTASFACVDALQRFNEQNISTPLYQGLRTGDAIQRVLDAAGWPADDRDIDPGATQMPWWWAEGSAGDELQKLVNSEGPTAFYTIDADGRFIFRDRHHRLLRPQSLTAQSVIRVTGSGFWDPKASWPMGYDHGAKAVINDVTFPVGRRVSTGELSAVWTSEDTYAISDGQTVEVTAQAGDPFRVARVPELGVDFTATGGGTPVVMLTRDSGQSTIIRITASGGAVVVLGLQLRACPVSVVATVQVHEEDPVSIATYGRRSWPTEAPWVGVHDARAIAQIILAQRAERRPTVTVTLKNYNDLQLLHMLSRDLSDRVQIMDAETGIDAEFFIEQIAHQIHGSGGRVHETTFACEQAVDIPDNVFTFDVAGKGFNDGVFGKTGIDNPDNIFLFDVAGHGFDDAVFAT